MPDSEPLPGAPQYIAAGDIDMQVFFDRIGMGWLIPFMPPAPPRLVTVSELCALPPPAAEPFTLLDVVSMQTGDDAAIAARTKLANWVDNDLWQSNCQQNVGPAPDPVGTQEPPSGTPVVPPQPGTDRMIRDIHRWTQFVARELVPRNYHVGSGFTVSGTGYVTFPQDSTGTWPVWPAGVSVGIDTKPDYVGRSSGADFPVFFDLGYFSLANGDRAQSPIRLQHEFQMTYDSRARVNRVYYDLEPGVTIGIAPLYPDTPDPVEE